MSIGNNSMANAPDETIDAIALELRTKLRPVNLGDSGYLIVLLLFAYFLEALLDQLE